MLLTIYNLPYSVTYRDVKALIYNKCGIDDMILDNLLAHDNGTKKVTIGLSSGEDAAIFMKNIDGSMMNGYQLRVVSKSRMPNTNQASQSGPSNSMQSYGQQDSNWSQTPNFRPTLPSLLGMQNQNVPTMVPPPANYGPTDMVFRNQGSKQSAFYMLNQPTSSTSPSSQNVGYQTGYGSNHNSVSNSRSNEPITQYKQEERWDNRNLKWENRGSTRDGINAQWESRGSTRDNINSQWDKKSSTCDSGNSKWDNSNPERNANNSKWDHEGDLHRNQRGDNSDSFRGGNSGSNWLGNSGSNWVGNSGSNWVGNSGSNWVGNSGSNWGGSSGANWGNNNGSNWSGNSGSNLGGNSGSNWSGNNDRRPNNSRGSQWQSSRDTNRDNASQPSKLAGSPRDRDTSSRGYSQNFSPRSSHTLYGNHVTGSAGQVYPRDNEPRQNRPNSAPRQRSPLNWNRAPSLPQKRANNQKTGFAPGGAKKNNKPMDARKLQIGKQWRGLFIANKTKKILEDPRFEYETPNPHKLFTTLRAFIKKRVSTTLGDDYHVPVNRIEKKYNKLFSFRDDWEAFSDCLRKTHGKLISKVDVRPANVPQGGSPQGPQQSGSAQELASGTGGNVKKETKTFISKKGGFFQGDTQIQRSQTTSIWHEKPKKNKKAKLGGPMKHQKNTPLSSLPGRIPNFPHGDKKQYKKMKKVQKSIMSGELSAPAFNVLKPALRKAIEEEVEILCEKTKGASDITENDESFRKFCNTVKAAVPGEMKRAFELNIARRMIPMPPFLVRVFAFPPLKRMQLETFFKGYKVVSLKKVRNKPFYIVNCQTVEDHDKLCLLKPVPHEGSTITFKPYYFIEMKKTPPVLHTITQKLPPGLQTVTLKDTPAPQTITLKSECKNDDDDDYEIEEYHVDENDDDEIKKEDISQEIKNISEQINNSEPDTEHQEFQTVEAQQTKEEADEATNSIQINNDDQDFTNDNVNNIPNNFNETKTDEKEPESGLEVINANNSTEPGVEELDVDNIDLADVNMDDLEDW